MITRRWLFGFAAGAVVAPMLPVAASARAWGEGGYRPPVPLPLPQIPQRSIRWVKMEIKPGYIIDLKAANEEKRAT